MLAHIREKMHHTDEVIDFTECDLGDAEIELIRARGDLGEVKVIKYFPYIHFIGIYYDIHFFFMK